MALELPTVPTTARAAGRPPADPKTGATTLAVAGALVLLLSGLVLIRAGMVRWQECLWFVQGCPVMGDEWSRREGFAEPVLLGALLQVVALGVLASALRRWWFTALVALVAAGIPVGHMPETGIEAAERLRAMSGMFALPVIVGVLALLGVLGLRLEGRITAPVTRAVAATLVVLGVLWSFPAYIVMVWSSGTWDDTPHWWTVQGAASVLGALTVLGAALRTGTRR